MTKKMLREIIKGLESDVKTLEDLNLSWERLYCSKEQEVEILQQENDNLKEQIFCLKQDSLEYKQKLVCNRTVGHNEIIEKLSEENLLLKKQNEEYWSEISLYIKKEDEYRDAELEGKSNGK